MTKEIACTLNTDPLHEEEEPDVVAPGPKNRAINVGHHTKLTSVVQRITSRWRPNSRIFNSRNNAQHGQSGPS